MLPLAQLRALSVVGALQAAGWGMARAQEPAAPAPRVVDLAGSRDRAGLFTQRLILPADFCGAVHSHDGDLHGLVVRGLLRLGLADSTGELRIQEYPAGSFVPVPAGRRHVEGSGPETEIHLSGIGPVRTVVLESPDPRRCRPK